MESIAARHGIYLAPLYNADGPVEAELDCRIATADQMGWPKRNVLPSRSVA
jgi:hypothetical protein